MPRVAVAIAAARSVEPMPVLNAPLLHSRFMRAELNGSARVHDRALASCA